MAPSRLDVARRYFDAWNAGDADATLVDIDPRITVDWSESNAPYAGVFRGLDEYRQLFNEIRHSFGDAWAEVDDFVEAGTRVAVRNTAHLRGRDGIEVIARSTIVLRFEDDKIVEAKLFQDHADALKAIGGTKGSDP